MTAAAHGQLTTDGREVTHPPPDFRIAPLTRRQRQIVAYARNEGAISSTTAGVIMHSTRDCSLKGRRPGPKAIACCVYAHADGLSACKRLAKRGLLERTSPGRWEPVTRG